MAAGIDDQVSSLQSEQASRAAEKVEAFSTARALKAALETISAKDKEIVAAQAAQAATEAKALADVAAARAEAEVAFRAVREEGRKAAEDEFAAGFFQGYSDLKRRVAEDHPEWDLAGYSGVDSDYLEAEVSVTRGATPIEEGGGSGEADDAA